MEVFSFKIIPLTFVTNACELDHQQTTPSIWENQQLNGQFLPLVVSQHDDHGKYVLYSR